MKVNVSHDGERNDGTNKEFNTFTSFSGNACTSKPVATRSSTTSSLIWLTKRGPGNFRPRFLDIEAVFGKLANRNPGLLSNTRKCMSMIFMNDNLVAFHVVSMC